MPSAGKLRCSSKEGVSLVECNHKYTALVIRDGARTLAAACFDRQKLCFSAPAAPCGVMSVMGVRRGYARTPHRAVCFKAQDA